MWGRVPSGRKNVRRASGGPGARGGTRDAAARGTTYRRPRKNFHVGGFFPGQAARSSLSNRR
eukprot:31417-Pelagococcus_subviridis.AAC.14